MKVISLRLPDWILERIDLLVEKRVFISRSEFIRYALRQALKSQEAFLKMENQQKKTEEDNAPTYPLKENLFSRIRRDLDSEDEGSLRWL